MLLTSNNKTLDLSTPQVMGIMNLTPDSFYAGSRKQTERDIAERTQQILREGGTIIDCGAMSTRPGSDDVSVEEELRRMRHGLEIVRREAPEAWLSIDTFRPEVARMAVEEYGADIINDVSETEAMFRCAGELHKPYILMSVEPTFEDIVSRWIHEVRLLRELGVEQIILDPGYGFGKEVIAGNYSILRRQQEFVDIFHLPLLTGISRKRMIWHLLESSADEALNGTTVLNTLALERGASILRVHDVKEAVETIKIVSRL